MQGAVCETIGLLGENPRHPGLRVHKVRGISEDVWEAYVDRKNRLTFHYEDGVIVLRNHCSHEIIDHGKV